MFFDRTKVYEEICEQLLEEIDQSISSLDSLEVLFSSYFLLINLLKF